MIWTIENFLVVNAILAFSSILQMVTGVSVGMIIVPFLALISYTLIPVPVVFASLVLTVSMALKGKEHIDLQATPLVSVGMFAGIGVALLLFKSIDEHAIGLLFGSIILLSVLISLKTKSFKLGTNMSLLGGFLAGLMGAIAAVGGQVLAMLFQNHSLESIKATLAFLYTLFTFVMLAVFYAGGEFSYNQLISGLMMMPGFLVGFLIAPKFSKYFNPKYTKTVVLSMATLGGLMLIIKSFI